MTSIFRPRQVAVQRVTPNAGNRRFVRGGAAIMRAVPLDQGELELEGGEVGRPTGAPAVKPPPKVKEKLAGIREAVTKRAKR